MVRVLVRVRVMVRVRVRLPVGLEVDEIPDEGLGAVGTGGRRKLAPGWGWGECQGWGSC